MTNTLWAWCRQWSAENPEHPSSPMRNVDLDQEDYTPVGVQLKVVVLGNKDPETKRFMGVNTCEIGHPFP